MVFGGKAQDDPIDAIKRAIFLVATPIGCLSMLVIWWTGLKQGSLSILDVYCLPPLAILYLVFDVLHWRNVVPLHTFELVVYSLLLAYALGEFITIILMIVLTGNTVGPSFTLWLPFVYILSFLILNTHRALLFSGVFFFITLILGVAAFLHFHFQGRLFPNTALLVQLYLASVFYVAALYLVAPMKERYISQRAIAEDMSRLAMIDSLTEVDNRRLLTQLLQEEVERVGGRDLTLSVLLLDLDWFKKINDLHGHNIGDKILREVAQLLRQNIRTSDPFGRWGGDEFLCLAINSDEKQAVELAERLREILQRHHFATANKVTASFGVTTYQEGDTPEAMIRRADLGLYKAKATGRNRVEAVLAGITLPLFEGEKPYPVADEEME
jgi:diguanylate cyclase